MCDFQVAPFLISTPSTSIRLRRKISLSLFARYENSRVVALLFGLADSPRISLLSCLLVCLIRISRFVLFYQLPIVCCCFISLGKPEPLNDARLDTPCISDNNKNKNFTCNNTCNVENYASLPMLTRIICTCSTIVFRFGYYQ